MLVPLIVLATSLRLAWGDDNPDLEWESVSGSDEGEAAQLYKRLYNFGLGKRAYSYVSEYKRLPVYNFGLGKRSPRHYNFGLGKRGNDYEEAANDFLPSDYVKRIRPYNFGLGKRAARQYNFGLGKRNKLYAFGLGKRSQDYTDLLDEEEPTREIEHEHQMAAWPMRSERSFHYNFGLGKRNDASTGSKSNVALSTGKE